MFDSYALRSSVWLCSLQVNASSFRSVTAWSLLLTFWSFSYNGISYLTLSCQQQKEIKMLSPIYGIERSGCQCVRLQHRSNLRLQREYLKSVRLRYYC